mgnify:FL=1
MDTLTTDDKTNIVTAIDNYARIRKELKKLELQKKELQAKMNTIKNELEEAQESIKQLLDSKNITDPIKRNNLTFEIIQKNIQKVVSKSEILDKLTEMVGEDKVNEAKALVEQNREVREENILKVREVKGKK